MGDVEIDLVGNLGTFDGLSGLRKVNGDDGED
jgi:hypothetical protein